MTTPHTDTRDRHLIAVIGDQDTVTGMLLAGIGSVDLHQKRNYLVVDSKTTNEAIEDAFRQYASIRPDIAILLITQPVADRIRPLVAAHAAILPVLLEIPSKDTPYDAEKDPLMRRVNQLYSGLASSQ